MNLGRTDELAVHRDCSLVTGVTRPGASAELADMDWISEHVTVLAIAAAQIAVGVLVIVATMLRGFAGHSGGDRGRRPV
jgi:hypothetical protein